MNKKPIFIDTNIIIYASGNPHPNKRPCEEWLRGAADGKVKAASSIEVLQEILYRYWHIREYKRGLTIFDEFIVLVPLILPVSKREVIIARELLDKYPDLPPRDAIHAAVMLSHGITTICSFDNHFDQVKGIKRFQPG